MKILMLFPYAPLPPPLDLGGTKRNLPFLLELAKYNEVSVLSFGTPVEKEQFCSAYGDRIHMVRFVPRRSRLANGILKLWLFLTGQSLYIELYHRSMQRAIDTMTAEGAYDLIHCCVQMFGRYRFPDRIPVTSDTHEVKYLLLRRTAQSVRNPLRRFFYGRFAECSRADEISLCKRFDLLTVTTAKDLEVFRKDLPSQCMKVVQNGASEAFFEDIDIAPVPFTMVFTGMFTHVPNSEGAVYFLDRIFPLIKAQEPLARVFMVGKNPTRGMLSRASESVTVTGFVDDVRPYIARGMVFIIPLLAGGGIRGKALEAMAMRRPIVTTSVGVEGIHLEDGVSALFADNPAAFTSAVLRLFRDRETWASITDNAYKTVEREYRWQAKGMELHRALADVVCNHPSR